MGPCCALSCSQTLHYVRCAQHRHERSWRARSRREREPHVSTNAPPALHGTATAMRCEKQGHLRLDVFRTALGYTCLRLGGSPSPSCAQEGRVSMRHPQTRTHTPVFVLKHSPTHVHAHTQTFPAQDLGRTHKPKAATSALTRCTGKHGDSHDHHRAAHPHPGTDSPSASATPSSGPAPGIPVHTGPRVDLHPHACPRAVLAVPGTAVAPGTRATGQGPNLRSGRATTLVTLGFWQNLGGRAFPVHRPCM